MTYIGTPYYYTLWPRRFKTFLRAPWQNGRRQMLQNNIIISVLRRSRGCDASVGRSIGRVSLPGPCLVDFLRQPGQQ